MSAIIIPSKNIFSKDYNPVIDNKIDKIEINTNQVKIIIDKDNLSYGETIKTAPFVNNGNADYTVDGSTTYQNSNKSSSDDSAQIQNGTLNVTKYFRLVSYSEMKLGFLSIPIKIYVKTFENDNKLIKSLNGGESIQYNSSYGSTEYSVSGSWTYTGNPLNLLLSNIEYTVGNSQGVTNKAGNIIDDNLTNAPDNQVSVTSDNKIKYHFQFSTTFKPENSYLGQQVSLSVNNDVILDNKTQKGNFVKKTDENGDYFETTLTVLCSRRIVSLINADFQTGYSSISSMPNHTMTGACYLDITYNITFNVSGEMIVLSVIDLLKTIGNKNSKNFISIDNNELLQDTNTNLEQNFQVVIDEWENGKQTATITCPIADYYDENGNKVIDISTSNKMLFSEGDIVVPQIYTNKGDKPLSYNKDFTPKQFRVVGTKISKEQGGMQELTLQEV